MTLVKVSGEFSGAMRGLFVVISCYTWAVKVEVLLMVCRPEHGACWFYDLKKQVNKGGAQVMWSTRSLKVRFLQYLEHARLVGT